MSVSEEIEFLIREKRGEEVERYAVAYEFRCAAIDEFDTGKREVLVSFSWRPDFSGNGVSVLEAVLLYLLLGNVDVVRAVQVVVIRAAKESIAVRHKFENAGCFDRSFIFRSFRFLWLRLLLSLLRLLGLLLLSLLLNLLLRLLGLFLLLLQRL